MVHLLLALACSVPSGEPAHAAPGAEGARTGPAAFAEPTEPRYAATQVLVSYTGATAAPAGVQRTRDEAEASAVALWARARAGTPLEDLAREASDAPSAPRGGSLGVYRTGTLVPDVERAVAALAIGELSMPFETPFGWHLVRRDPVVEVRARHVLITWSGAWRSGATRTRDEARARAEEVLRRLDAGEDFATVAKAFGDDATAATGGDLGRIAPGQLIPDFETALFSLPVDGHSGIVETPYGFHVVERLE